LRYGIGLASADVHVQQLGRQLHYASDKLQRQLQMGKEMQQRAQAKLDSLKQEYVSRQVIDRR
jgi:hypothetical protein